MSYHRYAGEDCQVVDDHAPTNTASFSKLSTNETDNAEVLRDPDFRLTSYES